MDERRGDLSINLPSAGPRSSAGNVTDVVADSGGLLLPMLCPIPALVTGCVGKGLRRGLCFPFCACGSSLELRQVCTWVCFHCAETK